ncbi:hypothetical protein ACFWPV_26040 [Streptomyces uncialis]|uniref:hypothetical protein n=1 Tax=Streptomyces uncialis TaxID=1048205 RepID=UPI00365A60E1
MISNPRLHGKTSEEAAEELRVNLTRIARRRKRFQVTSQNQLRQVRTRVLEAVAAGLGFEEAAAAAGYQSTTVSRWVAKHRTPVREVDLATARHRLDKIRERQRSMAAAELRIARRAKLLVRRAIAVEFTAEEFASITNYNRKAVERWFTAVRNRLEQNRRRRELASVRRGKANRPPQELSPAEYERWLAREQQRRKAVLQRYGMRPRRKNPAPQPGGNRLLLKSRKHRRRRRK